MATKDNQMETENSGAVVEEHDHNGNSLDNLSTVTSQGLNTTKGIMLCYQHNKHRNNFKESVFRK